MAPAKDIGQLSEPLAGGERFSGRCAGQIIWHRGANFLRQFAPCSPRAEVDFKGNQRVVVLLRSSEKKIGVSCPMRALLSVALDVLYDIVHELPRQFCKVELSVHWAQQRKYHFFRVQCDFADTP